MILAVAAAALLLSTSFSGVRAPDRYTEALSVRFPAWAVMNRRSSWVLLDLVVNPDGSIMRCRLSDWDGSERLAKQLCALIWNIRLKPARAPDGTAVHGYTRMDLRLVSRGGKEANDVMNVRRKPDIVVDVAGTLDPQEAPGFQIIALTEADGTVTECGSGHELLGPPPGDAETSVPASLVESACRQVVGTKRGRLVADDGTSSPYVGVIYVGVR